MSDRAETCQKRVRVVVETESDSDPDGESVGGVGTLSTLMTMGPKLMREPDVRAMVHKLDHLRQMMSQFYRNHEHQGRLLHEWARQVDLLANIVSLNMVDAPAGAVVELDLKHGDADGERE